MTIRLLLLLDENISPSLVTSLWKAGIDAICLRDRGMLEFEDHTVWKRAIDENRTVVTINRRHFEALALRSVKHPGIIAIPSGYRPAEQLACIMRAVTWAEAENALAPSLACRLLIVGEDGAIEVRDVYKREDPSVAIAVGSTASANVSVITSSTDKN